MDRCRSLPIEIFNRKIEEVCQDSLLKSQCFWALWGYGLPSLIQKAAGTSQYSVSLAVFRCSESPLSPLSMKSLYRFLHYIHMTYQHVPYKYSALNKMMAQHQWAWLCHVLQDTRFYSIHRTKKKVTTLMMRRRNPQYIRNTYLHFIILCCFSYTFHFLHLLYLLPNVNYYFKIF